MDGRDAGPLRIAGTYLSRLRGLLGTRTVDGALLLTDCNGVHGLGMIYALDVALLDEDLNVMHVTRLRPFGMVRPRRGVRHSLEARRGAFAAWGLRAGSRLEVR